MKRILLVATVAVVTAAMMLVMAMPVFAQPDLPENHPLETGECGNNANCSSGFGENELPNGRDHHGEEQSEDPGGGQSGEAGDERNDVCFDHGVCEGTNNN